MIDNLMQKAELIIAKIAWNFMKDALQGISVIRRDNKVICGFITDLYWMKSFNLLK